MHRCNVKCRVAVWVLSVDVTDALALEFELDTANVTFFGMTVKISCSSVRLFPPTVNSKAQGDTTTESQLTDDIHCGGWL
eukprot:1392247-Amorphochlora_amoeboformis.AAC.2